MRIDLRYVIVVAAFYAPGLLMLCGAWILGYSRAEAREFVGVMGIIAGLLSCGSSVIVLFIEGAPIWWRIGGGGK